MSLLSRLKVDGVGELSRRLLDLALTSRYNFIDCYLCADVDITREMSEDITKLQNALLRNNGNPPTLVHFVVLSPRSLPTALGLSVAEHPHSNLDFEDVERWLSDDQTRERLLFLLSLVPTLSVGGGLQCLGRYMKTHDDNSRYWFRTLFAQNEHERKSIEHAALSGAKGAEEIHPAAMMQLSFALSVDLGK